jgi:hypothetical protein
MQQRFEHVRLAGAARPEHRHHPRLAQVPGCAIFVKPIAVDDAKQQLAWRLQQGRDVQIGETVIRPLRPN